MTQKIAELFERDVTRDIPPVVYFHEQSPEKLAAEVDEYIVTGGFDKDDVRHKRVPDGIHEQYVRLLCAFTEELTRPGGPDLPASWISGFYGSGKSSFAKLLGLALDGVGLPDGRSLAEALLQRDTSPRRQELVDAWKELRQKIDPIAVVFDIGGLGRDREHIHSVCLRQVQQRLGYCSSHSLVAEFELKLERDGRWPELEAAAQRALGVPWAEAKDRALAEEDFSRVMHALDPERYVDPGAWFAERAGTSAQASSATEATRAIADMLRFRAPGKTLFMVVDEVSQYIHQDEERMLKLQSFVSELGQRLKGQAWLLVTGQQKLEESDESQVLGKLKDRFKPKLRVHLAASNIRDVVHKRLLQKTASGDAALRELFGRHRNDLKLFAYGCDEITEEDFVEVYPLLPGHIDLLLQITTALRLRSPRSQGDDQAIRGLLQLLGELFRAQRLAEMPVGRLVTLDQIYAVQHSALDSDTQNTLARLLRHCAERNLPLAARAAKAVALLELIQESLPTTAELVSRCLYDQLDRGSQEEAVRAALEDLRASSLLTYSEKQGYKIQSSSAEEWVDERGAIPVGRGDWVGHVQEALRYLVSEPQRPTLEGRAFPWDAYFSDSHSAQDVLLVHSRDPSSVTLDFRMLAQSDRSSSEWTNRSAEGALATRIVWVAGDVVELESQARELARSLAMVGRYRPRRESLSHDKKRLLLDEEARSEELHEALQAAVATAWMNGTVYFRGASTPPGDFGATFKIALGEAGKRFLPKLYSSFLATQVSPAELAQLLERDLSAPSPKFLDGELGILATDAGRYVAACAGVAPRRVLELVEREQGISGDRLLKHFGSAPYGYSSTVVQACVAGLLRASRVRIETAGGQMLTAPRDAGAREVFEKDREFRRASIFPALEGAVGPREINRICSLLEKRLGLQLDREPGAIADAVSAHFPKQAQRLRSVLQRLQMLPRDGAPEDTDGGDERTPAALSKLERALEACVREVRQTDKTVEAVHRHFDALNDGLQQLALYDGELTDEAVRAVRDMADVVGFQLAQLEAFAGPGELQPEVAQAGESLRAQLALARPWRDLAAVRSALETVKAAYREARRAVLAGRGEQLEAARGAIKARDGFATLTAEQSSHVLRPLHEALADTSEDAVAPALVALRDGAEHALERAAEAANEELDRVLSEGDQAPVRKVVVGLHNRVVSTSEELEAALDEIRERVEPELQAGRRVRLING
jgi:hypothetical protein